MAPALLERAGVPQPRDRLDPRAAARWLGHLPRGARRRQFRAGRGVAASGGCRSAFLVPGHRRRPGGLLTGLCGVFALVSPACLDILQVRRIFHAGCGACLVAMDDFQCKESENAARSYLGALRGFAWFRLGRSPDLARSGDPPRAGSRPHRICAQWRIPGCGLEHRWRDIRCPSRRLPRESLLPSLGPDPRGDLRPWSSRGVAHPDSVVFEKLNCRSAARLRGCAVRGGRRCCSP